jgi:hypothetical protein
VCFLVTFPCTALTIKGEMATGGENPLLSGLNPDTLAFNMDGLIAAAAGLQRDCRLPDFVIEKPEAWFKCVEVQLEDAKVVKSKEKYKKVLRMLPVHIIKELAPVIDNPCTFEDPYTELKQRLLAAYGCCKWKKLDSLLNFLKMRANEWPSVVLTRLNTLKLQSLEKLYMAIYLKVLPDGYREHFLRCQFKTEELAAVVDGLWEMRGSNPVVVAAVSRAASSGRQQQQQQGGDSSGGRRSCNNNSS